MHQAQLLMRLQLLAVEALGDKLLSDFQSCLVLDAINSIIMELISNHKQCFLL